MQFCIFFFTFKQSDFILKTTWFSKKTSEKRRPQKVFFLPQRSYVTPERSGIGHRVSLLNVLKH